MRRPRLAAGISAGLLSVSIVPAALAKDAAPPLPRARPAATIVVHPAEAAPSDAINAVPLPRPRPVVEPVPETVAWADSLSRRLGMAGEEDTGEQEAAEPAEIAAPAVETTRLPHPRPALELAVLGVPRSPQPSIAESSPPATAPDDPLCFARLQALGVVFERAEPIVGDCPVGAPIEVAALPGGVKMEPVALLNCATTEAVADWMEKVVRPAALRILGATPKSLGQNSAYVCRNRYDDPDAKISEHAGANALDIATFGFESRAAVSIGGSAAGSREARFEAEVRAGACDHFTTVLGPGSNAAHATHFHLDLAERRGGYRLCELDAPAMVHSPAKTKRE